MESLFPFPLTDAVAEAQQHLRLAVEKYQPVKVYTLFSGGYDSLCASHLAWRTIKVDAAVHVNTEIGIEETREFVRKTCSDFGWPLIEMHPPRPPFKDKEGRLWGKEGQTAYEAIVHRWGFPGPKGHTLIYNRLKERCVARLVQEAKTTLHDKVMLVTGVRKQESKRRMGYITAHNLEGSRLWVAPCVDWNNDHKRTYREQHQLPVNRVVQQLCMSGECLCGAFAHKGELAEIEQFWPEVAAYIRNLEISVRDTTGCPFFRWGDPEQFANLPADSDDSEDTPLFSLCWSCNAKQEENITTAHHLTGETVSSGNKLQTENN